MFVYLHFVETRLEIMLTNFAEKNKVFLTIKKNFQQSHFFKEVSPMLLVKKCNFFLYLFSIKIRIKIRFNNDLDSKQTFCYYKEKLFHSPKNRIFPRGLTHVFSQKYHLFLYLFSVKIRLEIMLNKV